MAYKYVKAEDPSVTKLYGERTVATSCQYFIKHITPTSNILDVGCGPGVITSDLAKIASEGKTIGIDNNAGIIAQASASFPPSAVPNLEFKVGDALKLDFPDNTFDVVHSHALWVHVHDPVVGLKEFYRVCKPGGIIVCRESTPSKILSLVPDLPSIRAYWDRAMITMGKMGGHPEAGTKLEGWAKEAGFGEDGGKLAVSKSPQWNPSHLHRTMGEPAEQAIAYGICTAEEMESWRKGWEEWEAFEGSEWVFETGEIVCWKGT
jgi:ubiquinone/menaquinone biosynthesis C-methylase UbiE